MKKLSILLLVVIIATSCSVGTYYPYAQNNFGAQSKVVLKKANFRVVRDVEAIVDINNTRLSRADVANSAYGELQRKAQLTGSQVLINVVIEEVRRESGGLLRLLFGMPKRVQHVAARATIIEFLDGAGNPTVSESYRPTYTHTTTVPTQLINNVNTNIEFQETPQPIQKTVTIEEVSRQYDLNINKLNKYDWQKSLLYSSYKTAFKYLIENEKLNDAMKVNKVLLDIFDNKLIKTNVEKQLSQNLKKGIPEYQTFLQF